MAGIVSALFFLIVILTMIFKILREYERAVVFRLGRFHKIKGPGLIILIPGIDKMVKVDMRTLTFDVPSQDIITKDNVSVKVNAVVYFRVMDPVKAVIEVENYQYATSQMAQTKLRDVLGQVELDDLLAQRDEINDRLKTILDAPGASRSALSNSSTLTFRRRWYVQWLVRPKPSVSVAPRSSVPKVNSRPLPACPKLQKFSKDTLPRCNFATFRL